jgi:peptidoglycan/LPS O-acetylase OafA/YrhL
LRVDATRWFVVAAIVGVVAAALIGIFDVVGGTTARVAIGFPIALVAAAGIAKFGPDVEPTLHRPDRRSTAVELAVFGICLVAGIAATDRATSADEATRYIGYFISLVAAKYVSDGTGALSTRAARLRAEPSRRHKDLGSRDRG